MSTTEKTTLARRDFFRMASLGAGAAVVAKATGASATEPPDDRNRKAGYRETEHVRKFYELARF